MIEAMSIYQQVVFCFVLGYGVLFGIGNLFRKAVSLVTGRRVIQGAKGQLLDVTWLSCIAWILFF